jgi:hypothetical protein
MNLLDRLRYTDNVSTNTDSLRVLVLGEQGSGKTHFAATWPNPIFLDFDRGLVTLSRQGIHVPAIPFDKTVGVYKDVKETLYRLATKKFSKEELEAYPELGSAKTIVIDSLSAMGNFLKAGAMLKAKKDPGADKAEFDQWGALLLNLLDIIGFTKDFPEKYGMNIVVTALPQIKESEYDKGENAVIPLIEGSYKSYVGADFDEVYFTECLPKGKEVEFILHTGRYKNFKGKSRNFGNIDHPIDNTYAALMAEMKKPVAK